MADYGIQVENSSGEIQIDSTYKNYALKQTGSTGVAYGQNVIDITDVSSAPIFAAKANSSYYHCLYGLAESGSNYTDAYVDAEGSFTLAWKTFVPGNVQTLPTYGLIIRNSSNEIVFSSADTWLKLKGVYSRSVALNATSDVTVNDAANNYFYLSDYSWNLWSESAGPPLFHFMYEARGIKYINATTVRIGTFQFGDGIIPAEITGGAWYNDCTLIEFGV